MTNCPKIRYCVLLGGVAVLVALGCQPSKAPPARSADGASTEMESGTDPAISSEPDPLLVQVRLNDEWADLVRKRQQRAEAIREKLQVVVSVDFQELPLVEALTSLLGSAAVEWFLDIRALADEGIRPTEPVTIRLRDVSVQTALELVQRPLALEWSILDDAVVVTTETKFEETRHVGVFLQPRLVDRLHDLEMEDTPRDDALFRSGFLPTNQSSGLIQPYGFDDYWTRVNGGVPGTMGQGDRLLGSPGDRLLERPGDSLLDIIQNCCGGHPWEDIDGSGGVISVHDGAIVVRGNFHQVALVGQFLNVLDQAIRGNLRSGSLAVVRPGYPLERDKSVRQKLAKPVGAFECTARPLVEVLAVLADRIGVDILLGLDDIGLATTEAVTVNLQEASGESVLRRVLLQAGGEGLTFLIDHGVVFVTAPHRAEESFFTTRIYDIGALGRTGSSVNGGLEDLIGNSTSGPWEDIDGSGGTIENWPPDILTVRQTSRVHSEVSVLLALLPRGLTERSVPGKSQPEDLDRIETRVYPILQHVSETDANWDRRIDQTVELIPEFVVPKSWGGKSDRASVRRVGGAVVIRQSVRVHRTIVQFLIVLDSHQPANQQRIPGMGMF